MKTGLNINSKQTAGLPRLFLTMFVPGSKNTAIKDDQGSRVYFFLYEVRTRLRRVVDT